MTTWIDIDLPYIGIVYKGITIAVEDMRLEWQMSFRKNLHTNICKFQARNDDGLLMVAKVPYCQVRDARVCTRAHLLIDYCVVEHNQHTKPLQVIEDTKNFPKEVQIAALYKRIIELQDHIPTIIKRKANVVRPVFTRSDLQKVIDDKVEQTNTARL